MGRRLRTSIPILSEQLTPEWKFLDEFHRKNRVFKDRQKRDYDRRYGTRSFPPIPDDSEVWITSSDQLVPARVVSSANTP